MLRLIARSGLATAIMVALGCPTDSTPAPPDASAAGTDEARPPPPKVDLPKASEPPPVPALGTWPPPLFEVAKGETGMGLFETRDGNVYVTAGPQVIPVRDGVLDPSPSWLAGLQSYAPAELAKLSSWRVTALGGHEPGAFFVTIRAASGSTPTTYPYQSYRWTEDRWRRLLGRSTLYYANPTRLAVWKGGTILSQRSFDPRADYLLPDDSEAEAQLQADEERMARAVIAETKPLTIIAGPGRAPKVEPFEDFDALPSGELFLVRGSDVEHRNRRREGKRRPLPGSPTEVRVVLETPNRAYAFGGLEESDTDDLLPYLARWDGETWAQEAPPPCNAALVDLSWSATLGTWVICRSEWSADGTRHPGRVYGRKGDGASWVALTAVGDRATTVVASERNGGLWVATNEIVYGPRPPARLLEAPSAAALTGLIDAAKPPPE